MLHFLSLKSILTGQKLEDSKSKQNAKNADGTWRFESDTDVKIVVLGAPGTGKSSIVSRFVLNAFPTKPSPTIGIEQSKLRLAHNNANITNLGVIVSLSILEVAQPEVKGKHCNSIFENADGIVFVVDAGDQKTGLAIDQWMLMIGNKSCCNPRTPKCVLVNKADGRSQMPPAFVSSLVSRNGLRFSELVSARTGKGVTEAMHRFVDEILEIKSARVDKLSKRSSGMSTGFKRYELEVMEAMTQELEHEQMPVGVYSPTPSPSSKSTKRGSKSESILDLTSGDTAKILKELVAQAKKTDLPEDDILPALKKAISTPELSESIVLLNSVHSFYQKLQSDLSVIATFGNEDRKQDLEKLEKQRASEHASWQKQLTVSDKTNQKIEFLKSTFSDTVLKWDRLIESLSSELNLSRSAGLMDNIHEFGFVQRNNKLAYSHTVEPATPIISLTLASSLPNLTITQSPLSQSNGLMRSNTAKSLGFGFRNAGRASPGPKSLHTSPRSTPSSSASTSPRTDRAETPFSNYYEQTLLAALAQNAT